MGIKDKDLVPQQEKPLLTGWPRLNEFLKGGLAKGQLCIFHGRLSKPSPPDKKLP